MRLILSFLLAASLTACGSDSGYSSDAQIVVLSPGQDASFKAGESIHYQLSTTNFTLVPPFNMRDASRHGEDEHGMEDVSSHEDETTGHDEVMVEDSPEGEDHASMTEENHDESAHEEISSEDESAIHVHDPSEVNPAATEGHYHIYLDEASGTDAHITAWDYHGEFVLGADIARGTHSLRFELRDNNHVIIGTPGSETILFFTVE